MRGATVVDMAATTLLILGASGDLTSRLLLPALGQLLRLEPDREIALLGAGSDPLDAERWRRTVADAFLASGAEGELRRVGATTYHQVDATEAAALLGLLSPIDGDLVIYFALPPAVTRAAVEALAAVPLPARTVLALEKPFGDDVASARSLNELLRRLVPEERIFRVDHFLGRSTLLNLLGVRFANRVLGPAWSAEHIESVDIRFDETLALEGRARYYDHAGAMIDMIQSHLLQVLSLVALEPPSALDAEQLRAAKTAALRATRIWGDDPGSASRRARYAAGRIGDCEVGAYVDEPGVDAARGTETYAELLCEVRTERWAGVPFRLRSGKALGRKRSEVSLRMRPVRHLPAGFTGDVPDGGRLTIAMGPDELRLELNTTGGTDPFQLRRSTLSSSLGDGQLLAYSEILGGILDGDMPLAVRAEAAEECWRILQPVRDAWSRGDVPLETYAAGSDGPPRL